MLSFFDWRALLYFPWTLFQLTFLVPNFIHAEALGGPSISKPKFILKPRPATDGPPKKKLATESRGNDQPKSDEEGKSDPTGGSKVSNGLVSLCQNYGSDDESEWLEASNPIISSRLTGVIDHLLKLTNWRDIERVVSVCILLPFPPRFWMLVDLENILMGSWERVKRRLNAITGCRFTTM